MNRAGMCHPLEDLLAMLRKGFVVKGWVVRYRPEEYRFKILLGLQRLFENGDLPLYDLSKLLSTIPSG